MPLNLDAYLGIHSAALKVASQRNEVLANNLANADTPGYRARDIDFRSALAAASKSDGSAAGVGAVSLKTDNAGHLGAAGGVDGQPDLKYRTPLAPALDGNTVDPQLEQAAFAENTVHYQATLTFLNSKFRNLMTAITGQ